MGVPPAICLALITQSPTTNKKTMNTTDRAIWHHLTRAIAHLLNGKRKAATTETKKALQLLQS